MDFEPRLRAWHEQAAKLLDDALAILGADERSPFSDGVLGEWVRELQNLRPAARHAAPIAALMASPDPLLREAGITLATTLLEHQHEQHALIEGPLAAAVAFDPEPWILEAVLAFLRRHASPWPPLFTPVYRALVDALTHPPAYDPNREYIHRNRLVTPQGELLALFEQHVIQTLRPSERETIILPLLEAKHGTRGFEATQRRILETMGYNAEEHRAALRRGY